MVQSGIIVVPGVGALRAMPDNFGQNTVISGRFTIPQASLSVTIASLLPHTYGDMLWVNHVGGTGQLRIGSAQATLYSENFSRLNASLPLVGQDSWVITPSVDTGVGGFQVVGLSASITAILGQTNALTPNAPAAGTNDYEAAHRPIASVAGATKVQVGIYQPAAVTTTPAPYVQVYISPNATGLTPDVFLTYYPVTGILSVNDSAGFANYGPLSINVPHLIEITTAGASGAVSVNIDGGGAVLNGGNDGAGPWISIAAVAYRAFNPGDVYINAAIVKSLGLNSQGFPLPDGTGLDLRTGGGIPLDYSDLALATDSLAGSAAQVDIFSLGRPLT